MTMYRTLMIAGSILTAAVPALAEDARVYTNKEAGIKAEYPNTWQKMDGEAGSLVMFVSPEDKRRDKFPEYVGLYVYRLLEPANSLESYTALSEKEVKQDKNAKLIESKPVQVSGLPGHRMGGTTWTKDMEMQWLQVWTVKNGKVYMATYVAEKESYKNFLSEAEKIMASISVL